MENLKLPPERSGEIWIIKRPYNQFSDLMEVKWFIIVAVFGDVTTAAFAQPPAF